MVYRIAVGVSRRAARNGMTALAAISLAAMQVGMVEAKVEQDDLTDEIRVVETDPDIDIEDDIAALEVVLEQMRNSGTLEDFTVEELPSED